MKLKVAFDSVLTLEKISYNSSIGGQSQQPQSMTSPVTLNWYNGLADSEGDWTFVTLTFKVSENANEGTYPITIFYEPDNVYDITETNINFAIENGSVTVEAEESEATVYRVAGATRYETAFGTAEALKGEMGVEKFDAIIVTCGKNFPDGLCGGALAYNINAPMILTATGKEAVAAEYTNRENIRTGYVLGSDDLISDNAVKNVFHMSSKEKITIWQ